MRNFTSWFTSVSRTFIFRKSDTLLMTLIHLLLPLKLKGLLYEPALAPVSDNTSQRNKARAQRLMAGRYITAFMAVLFSWFTTSITHAQNAPLNCDKYYMLVGELVDKNGTQTARTDVYQFGSSSLTTCKFESGGGGEGMCVDPTRNIAYIATCCNQGEVRVYNYSTASFETPIKLDGEDLLDATLSEDYNFLYVTTYNKVFKISVNTSPRAVVATFAKANAKNSEAKEFWGVAIHPTISGNSNSGRVYFTTNWQFGKGASTIERIDANLSGPSTLIRTAPSGFYYRGITFRPDGTLWAVLANGNNQADRLMKYNANDGTILGTYYFPAPASHDGNASQGDVNPFDIAFGPGGDIYVTTFAGDCVTKITYNSLSNGSNQGFGTYIDYQAGVSGKSITFVCGNFKCICNAPVINTVNVGYSGGTCNGSNPNNNGYVTISNLTYNANEKIRADIKEGTSYGTTPIYGAGSNIALLQNETTITFKNLKPNTNYTVRVWGGKDACYTDFSFKTQPVECCTNCISNTFVSNGDFAAVNTNGWTKSPSSIDFGVQSGGFVILNNTDNGNGGGDTFAYYLIENGVVDNVKYSLNATAATHNPPSGSSVRSQIYMEFYNGNSLLGTSAKFNVVNDMDEDGLLPISTITYTAPDNTNKIRIVGYSKGRALKFDNVVLTACYDPITLSLTADPNCSQNKGTITASADGGSGDYEYSLNNSTWQSSNIFSNLASGTYTIYVKDKNTSTAACKTNKSITLNCTPCICVSNNFVKNPNFDTAISSNDWVLENSGTPFERSSNANSGSFAILNNGDAVGPYKIYQTITSNVVAGKHYTLSAIAATHNASNSSYKAQIYFEFLNASNTVIGTSSKATITNAYNGSNLVAISPISMEAPSGATKIRIVGYSYGRALKFDTVVLTTCYDAVGGSLVKTDIECGQTNGTVTVTATGGSGSYEYSSGNNIWQASNIFSLPAGSYTISIRDKNATDCIKTLQVTLTAKPNPSVSVNTVKICLGETAVLTATGCSGTVSWSGGGTPSGSTLSVKPTAAGTTTYTATCTASNGCTAQAEGKVMTYPLPTITVNDLTLCAGETGTLTASSCTGTITWSGGGTPNGSTLSVNATGTYTATCKVTTNGKECSAIASGKVTVNPGVSIEVKDVVVCLNETATLTATGCTGGTISWTGGSTGSTLTVPSTTAGTYSYTATCK
ncbi:hypothetical protein EWM59_26120, partial [Emticicia agri]